jgi:hypothetical protein
VALTTGDKPNGRIVSRQFLGTAYLYRVALEDGLEVHSWQPHQAHFAAGAAVQVAIRPGSQPAVFAQGLALDQRSA